MSDSPYAITVETTRVLTIRMTEKQARDILGDVGLLEFKVWLRAALIDADNPEPAVPVKRQPRQPRQPKAAKAAKAAAAAPAKKAGARLTCAHCGATFKSQGYLDRHMVRTHLDSAPAAASPD